MKKAINPEDVPDTSHVLNVDDMVVPDAPAHVDDFGPVPDLVLPSDTFVVNTGEVPTMPKKIVPEIDTIAPKKTMAFQLGDISDPQGIKSMGDIVASVADYNGYSSTASPG